jgi:hypothetical protein
MIDLNVFKCIQIIGLNRFVMTIQGSIRHASKSKGVYYEVKKIRSKNTFQIVGGYANIHHEYYVQMNITYRNKCKATMKSIPNAKVCI